MDIYACVGQPSARYALVQLPGGLVEEMKGEVYLKAQNVEAAPHLVTTEGVYRLRVQNQSNFQMLGHCREPSEQETCNGTPEATISTEFAGFSTFSSSLSPLKVDPSLDTAFVFKLDALSSINIIPQGTPDAWATFSARSLASSKQFATLVTQNAIFLHNDTVVWPTRAVLAPVVVALINEWVSKAGPDVDFSTFNAPPPPGLTQACATALSIPHALVSATLRAFQAAEGGLDHHSVVRLVSGNILRRKGPLCADELRIQLRMALHGEYTPDVDCVETLSGETYKRGDDLAWVDLAGLDLPQRIALLFNLQPSWDLAQLGPLVADLNVSKAPPLKFLKNYIRLSQGKCLRK